MTNRAPVDTIEADAQIARSRGDVADDIFVFPASYAQQRLWIVDQLEPGRATYNIPINVRIAGNLDVAALQASLTYVVERHEVLRTVFITDEGRPAQVVLPSKPVVIPIIDLSRLPSRERAAQVARSLREEGNKAFDLRTGPLLRTTLFRTDSDEHVLALTVHHIVFDGWSLGVLEREIATAYGAFASGSVPALPELPIQYADFSVWQRERVEGAALGDQIAYWTATLRHPLPAPQLVADHSRGVARDHVTRDHLGGSVSVEISAETTEALRALGRHARTTPFTVLLAAFQVLLHRYTGQDDIIVGTPVAGRSAAATDDLIGCFINMLPLRADLARNPSFRTMLDHASAVVVGALANQDLPFDRLVELVQPERKAARNPLFQAVFSLDSLEADGTLALPGLMTTGVTSEYDVAKFDLQMILRSTPEGLCGMLKFDADLYDAETMKRLARNFVCLVREAVTSPDTPIDELRLLGQEEHSLVTEIWNRTATEFPRDATIHQLFEARASATPHAIAVEFEGSSLTYHELDVRANQLANRLQSMGVGPEVTVGLCVERSLEMVIGVLGILKAGGAYVPLDSALPQERLRFMVRDTTARVLLAQEHVAAAVQDLGAAVILIDAEWDSIALESHDAPNCAASAESLAYVMYTSGSTGTPKGVAVVHRGVVRLVSNTDYAHFGTDEVFLCFAPLAFDASTFEIWGALLNGSRLMIFPSHLPALDELGEFIERHGITTLWLTAALFKHMVDVALPRLRGVRQLLAGGDVLSPAHVRRVVQELPACQVVNGYGPTENTTFTCCHAVTADWCAENAIETAVPIGRPVANTTAYVLDRNLQPTPIGVAGRLYTGGAGVARGYLNNPELTAERFIPDAFNGRTGARLYETGDLARWRADGNLEFLGRYDDQVKLRGYRIEPGEIETMLMMHSGVQDAAVVPRRDCSGEPALVAYYVPNTPGGHRDETHESAPDTSLLEAELRVQLRARLPDYMIPSVFVALRALPLSSNGKLDRKALPAPGAVPRSGIGTYAKPRTAIEHELVEIWEALLPHRPIGIHDDFFELGGHSLLGLDMLFRIEQVRGLRLPLATLFEASNINGLGLLLESAVRNAAEPPIIVLNENARGHPFAFMHGDLHGGGWYCRRLAPLLDIDSPLILFRTFDGNTSNDPPSIEAMAAVHITELRKVQPHGPYRLGGFCAGGLVAFEMARRLRASGESVERLVLIDTSAANARFRWLEPLVRLVTYTRDGAQIERRARLFRRLSYYTGRAHEVAHMPRWEQLRWLRVNAARYMPGVRVASEAAPTTAASADTNIPADEFQLRPGTATVRFYARAASAFVPRAYPGEIDLINCDDAVAALIGYSARDWRRISRTVRVQTIHSSHLGLITSDLPALAALMRECLGSA